MRVIDLTPDDIGGGKYPTAFTIQRYFPGGELGTPPFWLGTSYSCKGLAIGPKRSWRQAIYYENSSEVVKVVGFGSLGHGPVVQFDMIIDTRSLDMIQNACCPPQILFDFMGTERIPT